VKLAQMSTPNDIRIITYHLPRRLPTGTTCPMRWSVEKGKASAEAIERVVAA
jgi:hypothetical protein